MLVGSSETADQLARLEHAARLPTPTVLGREDVPEVLAAAEGRGAVLAAQAKHLLSALRIDADDRRRASVRSGDEITDAKGSDRPESSGIDTEAESGCARPRMNASGATSIVPRSM